MKRQLVLAGFLAAGLALSASVAMAQAGDSTLAQARANGLIGEQADGYLGFVPGASISADLRGRVEQNNIQRRQVYTQRASQRSATVNEMALAVACDIFRRAPTQRSSIAVGERYRTDAGQWRTRSSAQPLDLPNGCAAETDGN